MTESAIPSDITLFDAIVAALPTDPAKRPAVVIVNHLRKQVAVETRKQVAEDIKRGRYFMASAPRCVFILEPATNDTEDDRVVLTCAKNCNGQLGAATAWHRRNGLFEACDSVVLDDPAPQPRSDFELMTPSECREFETPRDHILVGDSHITRGDITILAGVPGCGKSRLAVALAVAGATGADWMGQPVHSNFRTLILQAENGIARLKSEFTDIDTGETDLDEWLRITPPPTYGLAFASVEFQHFLRRAIETFDAGVLVIDPWNMVRDNANVAPIASDDHDKQPRRFFELMTPSECRDFEFPKLD